MRRYRIVFAATATEDLDIILTWLTDKAPHRVEKWFSDIKARVETLHQLPNRCHLAPENGLWGSDPIRQLLFTGYPSKYRILFTVAGDEVRILNIRHGARRFLHQD
jgi:plasmid stabilization system protein ParE